jgi:hypothetical protein
MFVGPFTPTYSQNGFAEVSVVVFGTVQENWYLVRVVVSAVVLEAEQMSRMYPPAPK